MRSIALLILAISLSALTSCASGTRPAPAGYQTPNLDIPPAQLQACPQELPPLDSAIVGMDWRRAAPIVLANHVAASKVYHQCRDRHAALSCTVEGQQGVTLNGARPRQREACTKGEGGD